MAYTALAYSYWTSFHDAYGCLCHAHYRYRPQLPYKSHRTYLTNHMGSISSHHIAPLVINSFRDQHTQNTHAYGHSQTKAILRNQVHAGLWLVHPWFKNCMAKCKSHAVITLLIFDCSIRVYTFGQMYILT